MYIYDESYYNDEYLAKLNDVEKTIMFKGSFVSEMGMTYDEVVEHIKEGKLVLKLKSISHNICTYELHCAWNGNSTTFKI